MKTLNIYLMRHGKVDAPPGLYGQTDVEVKLGEQQLIANAWLNSERAVGAVISSPLLRCQTLANIISEQHSLPVMSDQALQEMAFGDFDGVPFDMLSEHWKKLDAFWQSPSQHTLPNAESLSAFSQRVELAWSQIINNINDNVLIITHGGVIRMVLALVLGVDWNNPGWYSTLAIGNASVTHITVTMDEQIYLSVRSIGVPLLEC